MSLILDALRKLDREKSSRRHATADIAIEILRPELDRSQRRIPLALVTVAAIVVVTAALTYFVVDFGFLSSPSPPPAMRSSTRSQQAAPDRKSVV